MAAQRKRLDELNLTDRFLFDEAMGDPDVCRIILEIILGKENMKLLQIETEKELQLSEYLRGIRLDLFAVDEERTVRIFLNTRGTNDEEVRPELVELLHYIESTTAETAKSCRSEKIRTIQAHMERIRKNEEIGVKYMLSMEEKEELKDEGREEGREEGESLLITLYEKLIRDLRMDDMIRATSDRVFREILYQEYGLKQCVQRL